jgi:hypothetical protein
LSPMNVVQLEATPAASGHRDQLAPHSITSSIQTITLALHSPR